MNLQKISSTGTVEAASTVNLSFPGTGTVTAVSVKVGTAVKTGDEIASIDPSSLEAALNTAKANLVSAQAKYDDTVEGLSADEKAQIAISDQQSAAQLQQAKRSLSDTTARVAKGAGSVSTGVRAA